MTAEDEGDGATAVDREADDAALARVRACCVDLPEVEEAELQDRPLFRVRTRRFAIVNLATSPPRPRWAGFGRSLHVLADANEHDALLADPGSRYRRTTAPAGGWRWPSTPTPRTGTRSASCWSRATGAPPAASSSSGSIARRET